MGSNKYECMEQELLLYIYTLRLADASCTLNRWESAFLYQMMPLMVIGRHLESMASYSKSDSVNQCASPWKTICEIHPNPIWNDGALWFFEEIAATRRRTLEQHNNKKAELPQRCPRDAPYIAYGCPENFRESLSTPTATFPEIFNGLLFTIDPVNVRTKSEVRITLPVSKIIGGTLKLWTVPGYAHAPFSPKLLTYFQLCMRLHTFILMLRAHVNNNKSLFTCRCHLQMHSGELVLVVWQSAWVIPLVCQLCVQDF